MHTRAIRSHYSSTCCVTDADRRTLGEQLTPLRVYSIKCQHVVNPVYQIPTALCRLTQTHKVLFGVWVLDEGEVRRKMNVYAWFDTGSETQSSG